jgi:hypothetical protein
MPIETHPMTDIPLSSGAETGLATSGDSMSAAVWIAIVVLIAFFLFIAVIALKRMFARSNLRGMTVEQIKRQWGEIEQIASQSRMGQKMGIVEADKLLDAVLKSMAMPGQTLGERLKFACYKYPDLKKVWFAHRLRNQLVHEATFEISDHDARSAVSEYKRALKILHVL